MIFDDFEGNEEGRDVQLTIYNEVDEDKWKYVFKISYIEKLFLKI